MDFKKLLNQNSYFEVISSLSAQMEMEVYIVGGFVRDTILNRERNEIDFLVIGDGPTFAQKLANKLNVKNINIYKNFGTAHFRYKNIDFEFVGARKESYTIDSRNPKVEIGSFDDDINRRDFTINTLAISLNEDSFGTLIDKFNGFKDIEDKIIQTPLDPLVTFNDDPLRIIRAFRFASQLNFKVEIRILIAAEQLKDRLKIISQERITDELLKILSSNTPSIGLRLLHETKVLDIIFPQISNLSGVDQRKDFHHKDVFLHTCQVVDNISEKTDDVWLRFAALVHDIAKPQTKRFNEENGWTFHGHEELGARMMKDIFKQLKLPLHKLSYIEKLVRLHLRPIALASEIVTDSAIRRLSATAGEDLDDLITLCRADITSKNPEKVSKYLLNYDNVMEKVKDVQEKDNLRAFQSPVRGEEIMKICNLKPSRKVGDIKKAIEEAILDGKIPNKYEEAYEFLLSIKDEYLN